MGCGSSTTADTEDTNNNESPKKQQPPPVKQPSPAKQQKKTESPAVKNDNRNGHVTSQREADDDIPRAELPELRQEPAIEDVEVARTEPGYPAVRAPKSSKGEIFFPSKLKHIDQHARETPQEKTSSYGELIGYLTSICSTDLEKVRAIFVWLGTQAITDGDMSSASDNETPLGFMRLVKEGRASYASFFAVLCRHATLPCVIIPGYAKSAGYEVGDTEEKVKQLTNSWNAVLVDGDWRIVFPLWACCALVGHSSGSFTKVETKGKAVREREEQSTGTIVTQLNEYYFLTDPKDFIYVAFPTESRWQLLPRPWSLQTFLDVPHCRQPYFRERLDVKSKFVGRLRAKHGLCNIELSCDEPQMMNLNYQLYYNHEESGKEISSDLQLNSYVLLQRSETSWTFSIRCPQEGVYKFEVLGGHGYESPVCYFKIFCGEVEEECQPYPCNPGRIGYGPNADTEKAGVKAKSHRQAIIKIVVHRTIRITFALKYQLQVRSELVHSKFTPEELKSNLKEHHNKGMYDVDITVPEQGEYALQLYAQQKNENISTNVCNYLLTTNEGRRKRYRKYENAFEKNTRNTMQAKSHTKGTRDIDELSRAIERFETLDLDDKGDLAAAHHALELKKVKKELKDAINRRHLETLEKAITYANESPYREKVTHLTKEAEDVRDHLRKLDRIAHDVLAMQQTTISELRSYKYPPEIVFEIMQAVFLLLGDKQMFIEQWEDVLALMGKTGRDGMLRRVRQFDTQHVQPEIHRHVTGVLQRHTEHEACIASAGAGTFYVWMRNVSGILNEPRSAGPSERTDTIERTITTTSTVRQI